MRRSHCLYSLILDGLVFIKKLCEKKNEGVDLLELIKDSCISPLLYRDWEEGCVEHVRARNVRMTEGDYFLTQSISVSSL